VDGRPVGGIGIIPGEGISRVSAEVGYWLGKPYWRRGIGTAALMGMTKYATERFAFTRLFARVFSHNSGSIRILEKAGYVREGFMKQSVIKDGVVHDEYLYAWYG
jgi:ribosomal-protein-alanine N-acetyltransferase